MMSQNSNEPILSFIIPVKNGEAFVKSALQSVLNQSLSDIEVLVVDDHSSDASIQICDSFQDPRLRVIENNGSGLVSALNLGLENARGRFIARMDADDVCRKDRAELQLRYLEANPVVGCVCSDAERIDEHGNTIGYERGIIRTQESLIRGLISETSMKPIIHPTCMFRAELLKSIGYRNYRAAEDRDLWLRITEQAEIHRINEYLLRYRVNPNGVSKTRSHEQRTNSTMAIVNHVHKQNYSIDLYTQYPAVFKEINAYLDGRLNHTSRVFDEFVKFKGHLRRKRYASAIWSALYWTAIDRKHFWPHASIKNQHQLVVEASVLAHYLINALHELPAETRNRLLEPK
jgi:glycosyltransferase involved in cell wall biosynthesis